MLTPTRWMPSEESGLPARRWPGRLFAHGFSVNKRLILRRFAGDRQVRFIRSAQQIPSGSTLLLWGSCPAPVGLPPAVDVVRVEDGFLRSVGLGAELSRPVSWVMDGRGIYYDATRPSDLEYLLQTFQPGPQLRDRAARLRERIVASGITKYSVGQGSWRRPAGSRRVILVPGQVETDASLRFGAPHIRTNIALLEAVRRENPDAFLVYKAHPDVVAGLRARGEREDQAWSICDAVVEDVPMGQLLTQVDEVHVLTSLAGFEALLRHKRVVCYGQPFYAGWGLTHDLSPVERRTRRLTLDELVAGTLIFYPTYVSRSSGCHISPERALEELLEWRSQAPTHIQPWRHAWRAMLRLAVGCK